MLSTRWQAMSEMNRLRDEMDRVFGRFSNGQTRSTVFPALNMWEDEEHFYVEAELPGFELEDLEIYVTGESQLSISGHRRQVEHEGGTWHRQERAFGSFRRTFELPSEVNSDGVSATLKNGILKLTLPKREEAKPRRIEVKAN